MLHLLILAPNHAGLLALLSRIVTFTSVSSLVDRIVITLATFFALVLFVSLLVASSSTILSIFVILAYAWRIWLLVLFRFGFLPLMVVISFTGPFLCIDSSQGG